MQSEKNKDRDMLSIAKFLCFLGLVVSHCYIYGRSEVSDQFFLGENFWVLKTAASLNVCMLYLAFFSLANQNRLFEIEHRLVSIEKPMRYAFILVALENVISLFSYKNYSSLLSGLPLTSVAFSFLLILFFWKKNRYMVFLFSFSVYFLVSGFLPAVHEFERLVVKFHYRYLVLVGAAQFCLYFLFVIFALWKVLPFKGAARRNMLMLFSSFVLYRFSSEDIASFHYFIPRLFFGSIKTPVLYPFLVWNSIYVTSFAMYFIFQISLIEKIKQKKIMILSSGLVYFAYLYWFDFFNIFNLSYASKSVSLYLYKFSQVTLLDCFFQMLPLTSLLIVSYQFRFVFFKLERLGKVINSFSDSIFYIYLGIILSGNLSSRLWPAYFPPSIQLLLQFSFYFLLSVSIALTHKWLIGNEIKFKLVKRSSLVNFNKV